MRKVKVFPGADQASSLTESKFIMYVLRRSLCRRQPCSPCKVCLEFKPDRLSSDNRYDGARSWYQNFCVLFDSWIVCLIFKTRKQSRHALRPVPPKLHLEMFSWSSRRHCLPGCHCVLDTYTGLWGATRAHVEPRLILQDQQQQLPAGQFIGWWKP